MNEDLKNIETCLPESILAEVASVPTDPQFVSLVNESLDPLKQQAFQQAGSDAYNEVVASHQPYTFTSQVAQMKSNLILLLRRFWRFPFGSGTIRSLSDMWAHYITRLQGNETYGIQSRLDQLTDLPSAPLLVADRKIGGAIGAPDGVSLGRIVSDPSMLAEITEIKDDSFGWKMRRQFPTFFTSLKKLTLGCDTMYSVGSQVPVITSLNEMEELDLPYMQYDDLALPDGTSRVERDTINYCSKLKTIYADALLYRKNCNMHQMAFVQYCSALTHFYARRFEGFDNCDYRDALISHCDNLEYVYITAPTLKNDAGNNAGTFGGCPKLIHLEVGCYRLVDKSLNIKFWNPSYVLSDNPTGTDLVEDPTAHPTWNNLQQFLQNFRSFIVLRLANRKTTTALELKLSANVYNAVTGANSGWASQHTLAELGITAADLTDLETELGITSATIYATWLDTYTGANGIHWDINKAN